MRKWTLDDTHPLSNPLHHYYSAYIDHCLPPSFFVFDTRDLLTTNKLQQTPSVCVQIRIYSFTSAFSSSTIPFHRKLYCYHCDFIVRVHFQSS